MLINILLETIGVLVILSLESFFFTLFSFSVLIVISLLLIDKIAWKKWLLLIFFLSLFVDVILLRGIGTTLLLVSISTLLLYLLFLLIPQKQAIFTYIPYFLSIITFYILLHLFSPFFSDGILGVISWNDLILYILKSIISTLLIFLFNILIDRFRVKKDLLL